jgi:catechol 2,3-dioxygenase-like lactoylglutathione lyase family enzyme
MNSALYHLQINVDFQKNKGFYASLFTLLGWDSGWADESMMEFESNEVSLWFIDSENKSKSNYDALGVNHISIKVEKQSDVDAVANDLKESGIEMLFGTPMHRADFAADENSTYYQIMFESPDGILFEVVYVGAK